MSVNPEAALMLVVEIKGIRVPFIVDTGAAITVLQSYMAKNLSLRISPYTAPVSSASGHNVSILGQAFLPIYCESHYLPFHAVVVDAPGAAFTGLLGLDFITKYGADVIITERVLKMSNIELPLYKKDDSRVPKQLNCIGSVVLDDSSHPATLDLVNSYQPVWNCHGNQIANIGLETGVFNCATPANTDYYVGTDVTGRLEQVDLSNWVPDQRCYTDPAADWSVLLPPEIGTGGRGVQTGRSSGHTRDTTPINLEMLADPNRCSTKDPAPISLDVLTDQGSFCTPDSAPVRIDVPTDRSDRDTRGAAHGKMITAEEVGLHLNKQRHDDFAVTTDSSTVKNTIDSKSESDSCFTFNLKLIDKKTIDRSSLCLLEVGVSDCLPGTELIISGYDAYSGLFLVDAVVTVNEHHRVPILVGNMSLHPVTLSKLDHFIACNLYTSVDNIFTLDAETEFDPWPASSTDCDEIKPIEEAFDLSHLDPDTKALVVDLLRDYEDIFVHGKVGLGCTDVVEHHIDVQGGAPVKKPPYRVPFALREVLRKNIDEMIQKGVIRPSTSNWSSPMILVKRKLIH
jgi:hypothetical protein